MTINNIIGGVDKVVRTNILGLIKSLEDTLPKAEKRVANFIIEEPAEVLSMTSKELGKASQSSAATVIRLSKRLGMDSFPQMKSMLYNEQANDKIEGYSDIRSNEPLEDIKEKLLGNAYQSLSDTLPLLDEGIIGIANKAIEEAEIIYIFGMGSSYLVAQDISQKWNRIGKTCIVMSDTHSLIATMTSDDKKKLFIGVSNSGETSEVVQLMKIAQKNGLETMSITQFGENSVTKEANIHLKHIRVNEPAYRGAATVSLHVQFYLVDVLFYAYSSKHYKEVMNHIISSKEEIIAYCDD